MGTKQIYEYFQQMLDNFNGNNILFETGVSYLFSLKPENPYKEGSEEYRLFNKLSNLCFTWQKGGVDSKVSFRRMIAFAKQFCELVNENPFTYVPEEPVVEESVVEKPVVKEHVVEEKPVEQPQAIEKIVNEAPETVLGVVPEEKKSFFKRNKKKKEGA